MSLPVFTSQTGVESPEPTVVEHIAPRRVRINDVEYGLKTAAKIAHDRVEAKQKHDEWARQRDEAIGRQRARENAKKQAKIEALDADIARIRTALAAGASSDPEKAKMLLGTLEDKRNTLVEYTGRV